MADELNQEASGAPLAPRGSLPAATGKRGRRERLAVLALALATLLVGALGGWLVARALSRQEQLAWWLAQGQQLLQARRYTEAAEAYTRVLQLDPRHAPAYYQRAYARAMAQAQRMGGGDRETRGTAQGQVSDGVGR